MIDIPFPSRVGVDEVTQARAGREEGLRNPSIQGRLRRQAHIGDRRGATRAAEGSQESAGSHMLRGAGR